MRACARASGHTAYSHTFDHVIAPKMRIPHPEHEQRGVALVRWLVRTEGIPLEDREVDLICHMILGALAALCVLAPSGPVQCYPSLWSHFHLSSLSSFCLILVHVSLIVSSLFITPAHSLIHLHSIDRSPALVSCTRAPGRHCGPAQASRFRAGLSSYSRSSPTPSTRHRARPLAWMHARFAAHVRMCRRRRSAGGRGQARLPPARLTLHWHSSWWAEREISI